MNEHSVRKSEQKYQDDYFAFDDREAPDSYEVTMPETFAAAAPGDFTWDEAMGKWVMTLFHEYPWDFNYRNPAVLIAMMDIILRRDAVVFLWKKIGSASQNEREAHLLLQLMKDCCQVIELVVLFIVEAIVSPSEIAKYSGEDAIRAKACEIA